jgi:DNA-binding NarL/FixJ family response regulator
VDLKYFKITSIVDGGQSLIDYFEKEILPEIERRWPAQSPAISEQADPEPNLSELPKRGISVSQEQKLKERKSQVAKLRAQNKSISDIAEAVDYSEDTVRRDLGKRK